MRKTCFNVIISLLRPGGFVKLGLRQGLASISEKISKDWGLPRHFLFSHPPKHSHLAGNKFLIDPEKYFCKPLKTSLLSGIVLPERCSFLGNVKEKALKEAVLELIPIGKRSEYLNRTWEIANKVSTRRGFFSKIQGPDLIERISCGVHGVSCGPAPIRQVEDKARDVIVGVLRDKIEKRALLGTLTDPNRMPEDYSRENLERICPQLLQSYPELPLHLQTDVGRKEAIKVLRSEAGEKETSLIHTKQVLPLIRSFYPEVDRYKEQVRLVLALTTLITFIWLATFTSLIDPIHRPSY